MMPRRLETLALIPARGGSNRLPRKNLALLNGIPLISHTIRQAKQSELINCIVVTTDDDDLACRARQERIEVIARPGKLAQGEYGSMLRTVQHALNYLAKYQDYKPLIVVLLQPTSPLRTVEDIDACIRLLIDSGSDTVLSVAGGKDPSRIDYLSQIGLAENGALYVLRYPVIMEQNRLAGNAIAYYQMPLERSLEIHTVEDLAKAEEILKQKRRESINGNIIKAKKKKGRPGRKPLYHTRKGNEAKWI